MVMKIQKLVARGIRGLYTEWSNSCKMASLFALYCFHCFWKVVPGQLFMNRLH